MKHNATITTKEEKAVEEYWVLQASEKCSMPTYVNSAYFGVIPIESSAVVKLKEFNSKPTIEEIAQFLSESQADFVTVSHNYRFEKGD